jgi:ABC-type transport system involved in cytochrome bd biosynthesis fused ATPase/permease subunit
MSRRKNLLTLLKGIATIPALVLVLVIMMVTMIPAIFLMIPAIATGISLLVGSTFVGLISPSFGSRVSRKGNQVMEFTLTSFFEKWVDNTVGRFMDAVVPFTIL